MDISVYLAKVLGPYLFIMAIVMYTNMHRIKNMINDANGRFFMLVSGAKLLLFGLLIVACNNVWEGNWKSLISLIGWVLIVRGVLRLLFPEPVFKWIKKVINN